MACYHPWQAWRTRTGDVVFVERGDIVESLTLACGRCVGCRLERSRQWAVRVMHEASLSDRNSFVTLTYSDDHVPSDGSLRYPDFQRFMKRLRKRWPGTRFYMCGEYGEEELRPHFHVGLFGIDFHEDRYHWRKSKSGFPLFRSPALERLWTFGSSEIGNLDFESAAYMARYCMKKVNGDMAREHYKRVDTDTGEVTWRVPEFTRMSLKPRRPGGPGGIGAEWFERFGKEVFPHDRVISNGVPAKPPRYYDQLLKRQDPDALERIKEQRVSRARERHEDNTPERLAVREVVATARLNQSKRTLK